MPYELRRYDVAAGKLPALTGHARHAWHGGPGDDDSVKSTATGGAAVWPSRR